MKLLPLTFVVALLPLVVAPSAGEAADTPERSVAVGQLEPLQDLVGVWKGVGAVSRGSRDGGWIEEADWHWKFVGDKASIDFTAPAGKHFVAGKITAVAETGPVTVDAPVAAAKFHLDAKLKEGAMLGYSGTRDAEGVVTLNADDSAAAEKVGAPSRVVIRLRAEGARLSIMLEKKQPAGDAYARLAEIGYTRVGSGFGKGNEGPICVVTGGQGTMAIMYKGKLYYVCCTGCKDAFDENPDEIIAEYEERQAKKKKEAKK
jgi:YHS domain-containing protein